MKLGFGLPEKTNVTMEHSGKTETIESWGQAHVVLTGEAGRMNAYTQPLTNPGEGDVSVRSDGKTILNLLDMPGAGEVLADLPGNRKAVVRTSPRKQQRGHPNGEHYWLPVDSNNRFVCEPGARHRKLYVSKSSAALTKAQIAAHAGVAEVTVTGAWLATRPQYGGSAATKVHWDVAKLYLGQVFTWNVQGRSDHIFFERGHNYDDFDWVHASGESEIHPLLLKAFGTGERPGIGWGFIRGGPNFVVIQDMHLLGAPQPWYSFSTAFDHCTVTKTMDLQWTYDFTVREVITLTPWKDAVGDTVSNGTKLVWKANGNHMGSIYSSLSAGLMVEGLYSDHAGWADGYAYDGDATMPMPPFKYSHAIYLSGDCYDVTLRHNFLSRASSCGMQLRAGFHVEGNLFLDHNLIAALNSANGLGQFSNVLDNVAFSAGYKRVAYEEGAFNWGYDASGPLTSMKGNVIAHHANPDDAAEIAAKPTADGGVLGGPKLVDDTQVWKWGQSANNRNVEGLNATTLDQTTIQRYAAQVMGQPTATIPQFAAWAKTQPSYSGLVKAAVDWTKARFGKPRSTRTTPASLTFTPDTDFEGFRWDNRYNWSTLDLPGRNIADAVDLDGHYTKFGNMNATIGSLTSDGGIVEAVSGRLKIGTMLDAANFVVRKAGQVWIEDADQALTVRADSGRLNLLGTTASLDLDAIGHAEILLGPDCTVPVGKVLTIGGTTKAGWDGTGSANLLVQGKLEFISTVEVTANHPTAGELGKPLFWVHMGKRVIGSISGMNAKFVDIEKHNARPDAVKFWLSDMTGLPAVNDVFDFAATRNLDGTQTIKRATVTAIGPRTIPQLRRFRSGSIGDGTVEPTITPTVTLASTAIVEVDKTGLAAGTYDLTGSGVTVVNQGATLPAGVTVTGGKLVLVVS